MHRRYIHTFQPSSTTAIAASLFQSVSLLSPPVPITTDVLRVVRASTTLSPGDASGKLTVIGVSVLLAYLAADGTVITAEAVPLVGTVVLPFVLPATGVGGNSFRWVAEHPLDALETSLNDDIGITMPASLAVQAVAFVQNTDGAGAHNILMNVGATYERMSHAQ